jgi:hypothetical protein
MTFSINEIRTLNEHVKRFGNVLTQSGQQVEGLVDSYKVAEKLSVFFTTLVQTCPNVNLLSFLSNITPRFQPTSAAAPHTNENDFDAQIVAQNVGL